MIVLTFSRLENERRGQLVADNVDAFAVTDGDAFHVIIVRTNTIRTDVRVLGGHKAALLDGELQPSWGKAGDGCQISLQASVRVPLSSLSVAICWDMSRQMKHPSVAADCNAPILPWCGRAARSLRGPVKSDWQMVQSTADIVGFGTSVTC